MKTNRVILLMLALLGVMLVQNAQAFYNPSTGRWLSRDPIGEDGGDNLYSFVDNNPQMKIDARGQIPIILPAILIVLTGCNSGCTCESVSYSFTPGNDQFEFGWYGDRPKYGSKMHVKWKVSGNPKKCKFLQDETTDPNEFTALRLNPLKTKLGPYGTINPVSDEYTDEIGVNFTPGDEGTWEINANFTIILKCTSSNGQVTSKSVPINKSGQATYPH